MKEDEMTLKQAMDFLGIKSRITMRKYADNGAIPSKRISTLQGDWRVFRKKDLVVFKSKMAKNRLRGFPYFLIQKK